MPGSAQRNGGVVMTLADMTDPEGYLRLPRIAYDQLRFLWITDYRDDVRSGVLIYQGELCWYQVVVEHDEAADSYRRFAVLRLSAEQIAFEKRWHEQLQESTGEGRDWMWFIEAYRRRTPPDYTACEALGWFEC
jgi:hypothetical protein